MLWSSLININTKYNWEFHCWSSHVIIFLPLIYRANGIYDDSITNHFDYICLHDKEKNFFFLIQIIPAGNYLLKVNIGNTRTMCEICLRLTKKTPELCHWRRSNVYIVNFEQISHIVLVFPLLTLSK